MAKRLTTTTVTAAKAAPGARFDLRDQFPPGFMLRVAGPTGRFPIGTKTWSLLYKVRGTRDRRRLTLGRFPIYDLDTARQKAMRALHEAGEGRDPSALAEFAPLAMVAPKHRKTVTVPQTWNGTKVETLDALVSEFLTKHAAHNKSALEYVRILHRHLLGWDKNGEPLAGVKAKDTWRGRRLVDPANDWHRDTVMLRDFILENNGPVAARHFFAFVRKMFNWAEGAGIRVGGVKLGKVNPLPKRKDTRDTWLEREADRVTFWRALDQADIEPNMRRLLRFILVTGQRPGEVRGLHKREIDRERARWLLPADRAKNGREHLIPLTPRALAILDEAPPSPDGWLFPSKQTGVPYVQTAPGKALLRLRAGPLSGVEEFTPHDLRRTCNSGMRELGVSKAHCRMVLNHSDGDVNSKHYDKWQGETEKRAALALWADHLTGLLTPAAPNVIPLRAAG